MCIGPNGDEAGVCIEECAIRMARAGADLVGLNCIFDPFISLEGLGRMKVALDSFNLKPHLMVQPLGYKTPDAGHYGWVDIPEFPYGNNIGLYFWCQHYWLYPGGSKLRKLQNMTRHALHPKKPCSK